MKKVYTRVLSVLLALALLCGVVPFSGLTDLTASSADYAPGDIITFGSYPQTKVTDSSLITILNTLTLSAENTVTYNDTKYKKVFFTTTTNLWQAINGYNINTVYWFKFEPIQWRILSSISGELFVLAEKILELKAYNQLYTNVTWESCTMRSWLNSNFYNSAFSSTEKLKINTSTIVNGDNPDFGTDGGNNTNDKLYLLSSTDVTNTSYGFSSNHSSYDTARQTQGTDFSKSGGLHVSTNSPYLGNSSWWLRTPGTYQSGACNVNFDGYVKYNSDGVNATTVGVRPAFKINLSSVIFTSKLGSNCAVDYLSGFVYGLDPGISSLEDYAEAAPGYDTEYVETPSGFGTGTVVNITREGVTTERYDIIIFGDVTGDGSVDSIDAGMMVDYENYLVTLDPAADAAFIKAGDLNDDGTIDSIDAGIAVDVENYIMGVNQLTGIASVIAPIDGAVVISGILEYGQTLRADVENITPVGVTLKFTWKQGAVVVGTGSTFTIGVNDIGKLLTVTAAGKWAYEGSIRSAAVTLYKRDVHAPEPPVLAEKTPDSVTLAAVVGQEYKVNNGAWQASPVFAGLTPNTEYSFYSRVIETPTDSASPESLALKVTTYGLTVSGTVTISGTAKYGEVLTADISGVSVPPDFIACQWKRGEDVVGSETTYTVTAEDIGQPLTVTAIGTSGYEGSVTSDIVIPGKAAAAAPAAPTLAAKTASSVTLAAIAGREYRVDSGDWQASPVFAGLSPNKAYSFYTRLAETATASASPTSAVLSATTDKVTISGTVVIVGSASVGTVLTADPSGLIPPGATISYRWKSDGTQVGTSSTYTVDGADIGTTLTVTVTGTGDYTGSVTSAATGVVG